MKFADLVKAAVALVCAALFALFLNFYSGLLVMPTASKAAGYDLPTSAAPVAAKAAAVVAPLPELLAKADPAQGQALTKVCAACHGFDKGGAAKVGPNLYGVVGGPKASFAGFAYSDGMKAKGGAWSFDDLNAFLTSPKAFVSGTKMGFAGEPDAAKRAAIIAYLRSLSDSPVPLPAK